MAKAKKLTENQKAYRKERRRIQQFVKRAENRGYIFPEDVIPDIPKRVTKKSIEKIKAIKPKQLYKVAEFLDITTGEVISGEERRIQERKEAAQKRKATKALTVPTIPNFPTLDAISRVRERIIELERKVPPYYSIENRKSALMNIFEDTVTFYSENLLELEEYLKEKENSIAPLLDVITYDSKMENIEASFAELAKLLNRAPLSPEQSEEIAFYSDYLYHEGY